MKNGHKASVSVMIPWMPVKCSYCHIFGHNQNDCSNKQIGAPVKVWRPKKVMGEGKEVAKKVDEQREDNGRQSKVKGKEQLITDVREATGEQASASSLNRFSILDSMDEPELTAENHEKIDEKQVHVDLGK